MNGTPTGMRLHIGIFGKVNVGKSSLINSLTNQERAIVSEVPGTTTDPVGKGMEISSIGPCFIIDTAGLNDTSILGKKRVERALRVIKKIDIAIIVSTYSEFDEDEWNLLRQLEEKKKNYFIVFNKVDIDKRNSNLLRKIKDKKIDFTDVSCKNKVGIDKVRQLIIKNAPKDFIENDTIIGDIIKKRDLICLVTPIDTGAPKGRIILPQVNVLRDVLDNFAINIVLKESELHNLIYKKGIRPDLVITDSQAIYNVNKIVPDDILLTTFSIVFTRYRGDLSEMVRNVFAIDHLQNNDRVLISEACTHHPMPDDIGRKKIPHWIRMYTKKNIGYDINTGHLFKENLKPYKLIVNCGGCMINRQAMLSRIKDAKEQGLPITNYGVIISYLFGYLERTLEPFKNAHRVYTNIVNERGKDINRKRMIKGNIDFKNMDIKL